MQVLYGLVRASRKKGKNQGSQLPPYFCYASAATNFYLTLVCIGCRKFSLLLQNNAGLRRKQGPTCIFVWWIHGRSCVISDALSGSGRVGWFHILRTFIQISRVHETVTAWDSRVLTHPPPGGHLGHPAWQIDWEAGDRWSFQRETHWPQPTAIPRYLLPIPFHRQTLSINSSCKIDRILVSFEGAFTYPYLIGCDCGLGPLYTTTTSFFIYTQGVVVVDEWIWPQLSSLLKCNLWSGDLRFMDFSGKFV